MHTIDLNSRTRDRRCSMRSRWLTAAMTVAALVSGGGVAVAAPAADAAPLPAINCPSAACEKTAEGLGGADSVAMDKDGNAYVTDSSGGRLLKVKPDGTNEVIADGLSAPEGVAVDGDSAYVAAGDSLWKVGTDGETQPKQIASGIDSSVEGVALDRHGNAFVASKKGERLWSVNLTTGRKTKLAEGIGYADGVAVDSTGDNVYVTTAWVGYSDGKLLRIPVKRDEQGRPQELAGRPHEVTTELNDPQGLALSPDGTKAYAPQYENGKLDEVDLKTGKVREAVTGLGKPAGLAFDSDGNARVADYDGNLWQAKYITGEGTPTPPPPPIGDAKVDLQPVSHITAKPGGSAVPRINVKNTGGKRIGSQDVTLKLGPEGVKWGFNVVYQDRDGNLVETPCHVVDGDAGTSVCKGVPLNLDPGQSVELRTEVGTSSSLKPGDMPSISWQIADKTAKTDWLMK
jgi:DNA-binding beta-propeller fold protein YncE